MIVLFTLALFASLVCTGYTFLRGSFSCAWDTSYCASSAERVNYAGRFFTYEGRPIGATTVTVSFETLRRSGDDRTVEIATDPLGRFCFRWPMEAITPSVDVARTESTAPTDPRFAHRERLLPQLQEQPGLAQLSSRFPVLLKDPRSLLSGAGHTAVTGWNQATDAAANCVTPDRGPPWYRVQDPSENWRFVLLLLLGVAAAGLLVLTLVERGRRQAIARTLATSTLALQLVLTLILWELYV
jgi:hypothetical protein